MAPFKSTQSFSVGQFLRTFRNRDAVGAAALNSPVRTDRIPVQATGGTVLIPGNGYQYHYFTGPGNFSVLLGGLTQADYLIIGGGGSGGNAPDTGSYQGAGGGGAGEFLTGQITTLQVASYPVVIGAGGLYSGASGLPAAYPEPYRPTPQSGPFPGASGWYGGNGVASSFNAPGANGVSALNAAGGGSGGGGTNATGGYLGQVGGSAGGSGGYGPVSPGIIAGSGDHYPGSGSSFPSPSNGWGSDSTGDALGSGGGGAGQRGGAGHSGNAGGAGLPAFNGDTGIPPSYGAPGPSAGRWFAGGGGLGGDGAGGPYAGGSGGGGAGGVVTDRPGTNATANTGSGGGGSGADDYPADPVLGAGGSGADGIVIIRYAV
jgi:hypothetical protein